MAPPLLYITGFGPFGPHEVNVSQTLVEQVSRASRCACLSGNLFYMFIFLVQLPSVHGELVQTAGVASLHPTRLSFPRRYGRMRPARPSSIGRGPELIW